MAVSRTPLTWPGFILLELELVVVFKVVFKLVVEGGGADVVPVSLTGRLSIDIYMISTFLPNIC